MSTIFLYADANAQQLVGPPFRCLLLLHSKGEVRIAQRSILVMLKSPVYTACTFFGHAVSCDPTFMGFGSSSNTIIVEGRAFIS